MADLAAAGAVPVVMDGLDRDSVLAAIQDAAPEVIVNQMTSLGATKDFRRFDEEFAVTNELRTRGTDYLLEAARLAGTRRFIAQSFTGFTNTYAGTLVKTEDDPPNPDPPATARRAMAAIRHVDETVPGAAPEGIVLRYGLFYGHGASNGTLSAVRAGKFPVIGRGTGIWSFCEITDAASATRAAVTRGAPGVYNIVDDIAGPSIRAGLHASGGELELVVSGYTLAYATLLVTCARLGEARGYRPMFLAGLGLFIAASLACGLAPDAPALVAARVVAGGAAALMTAQVLTGIQLGFEGRARARALGLYALVLSAGAVAGQSLGGLLISADVLGTTWRPAFFVNIPIGIAVLWLAWRYLPAGARSPRPLDLAGVAAIGAAMVLLVLPLMLGQGAGWPPWTWACLAASGLAFAVLCRVERRVSRRGGHPLVDLQLIARPAIAWGLAAQAVATATYFAVLFTLALYLQQGLGKSAAYSGLALVSWVAAFGVPGLLLGRATTRVRSLAAPAGPVILAGGFAGLAASLRAGDTSGTLLMALLGVAGLGLGTGFTGVLSHLTSSVSGEHAAGISGLFGTVTRATGLIGTAVFGTVYLALARDPGAEHAIHAFALVNLAMAATALAAAALAWLAIRTR